MTTPSHGSPLPDSAGPPPTAPHSTATLTTRIVHGTGVIIVSSVMFTFISYWRTAAVVLCDLASTAYYIGGIVEQAIGPAAPWFILAVMLFSYAVRCVYIESCSLFVRGGVYKVVKEAMGGFLGKLSVCALMFDYILTGPTSGVSAGQYIMGLLLDSLAIVNPDLLKISEEGKDAVRRWGSVLIACAVTLYFFRQNLIGIHESSGKALKIMVATTIMAGIMLLWCGLTLLIRGPVNPIFRGPDLNAKVEYKNAAAFRLNKDAFAGLVRDRVPEPIRAALTPLTDQTFGYEPEFNRACEKVLGEQEWKAYGPAVRAEPRIVENYQWTTATLDTLSDIPAETLDKLSPVLKKEFATTREFERQLDKLLSPQEFKEFRYEIMEEAANTKVKDRVTGEMRSEWARNPDPPDNLLPKLDRFGNPRPKINKVLGEQEDPRGFIAHWFPNFARKLANAHWLSLIGVIGLFIAFGHSILAMCGEETLAQVYREVESPKLPNFKKAAFIVFVYSLVLTASISFLAVHADPRRGAHEGLRRQPHRRPGHVRAGAAPTPGWR